MKRKLCFLMMTVLFLGFTACKNDDHKLPIEKEIAGAYKGTLDIVMYMGGSTVGTEIAKDAPQKVYLYKVDDETVKMELKNLSVINLDLGTISIDQATVIENGDSYSFAGSQELDLTNEGIGKCIVKVEGNVKNEQIALDIDVEVPAPWNQTVKVTFTGKRLTGSESSAAEITSFVFEAGKGGNDAVLIQPQINGSSITFMVADTTSTETLNTLIPTITVSEKATLTPASGVAQDFSQKVTYTVMAEDGTQQVYTVSVAQTMSFYDFESWINNSKSNYDDPAGWCTSNAALSLLKTMNYCPADAVAVGKIEGKSGQGARIMTNDTKGAWAFITAVPKVTAATLFLGEFEVNLSNTLKSTHFGVPYYDQPETVKGYYKYKAGETYYKTEINGKDVKGIEVPGMADSCVITAVLFEVNDYEGDGEWLDGVTLYDPATTNIVAMGVFMDGAEKSEFTPFEVKLKYSDDKVYDSSKKYKFSIICSSSKNGAEFAGAPGSELIIDDVEIVNK